MDIANLPRYEMGRCISCGDCNREPAYLDSDGQWVKFEEAVEASSNSPQQLKAEIAAHLSKVDGFPKYNIPGPVCEFIEAMRQLSAV